MQALVPPGLHARQDACARGRRGLVLRRLRGGTAPVFPVRPTRRGLRGRCALMSLLALLMCFSLLTAGLATQDVHKCNVAHCGKFYHRACLESRADQLILPQV